MLLLPHRVLGSLLAVLVSLASVLPAAAADVQVERWQPADFSFTCKREPANPFQASFEAELTGPNGAQLRVPGFYDGAGTWKIRAAASIEGPWKLTTHSDVAGLDNRTLAFQCVEQQSENVHGALRVDPEHPRSFVFEDGTRFLPLGYECDWLWALDVGDPALPTINAFLDRLVDHGFNYIILNGYAHDTSWRRGRTSAHDFGPPAQFAWAGTNEKPNHSRFNLAYWQHYDRVMQALHRRGIIAHVLLKVYNKNVSWPANGSAEDDQYYRWMIARYAAYPNVIWDLSKESQYEKDVGYKLGRCRFIRATDPYGRLLTIHDDRAAYDRGAYNDVLDFRSDQQHEKWRQVMADHHAQREWPVINTEFGYEHGPGGIRDRTYNVVQSPEEVARRAWEVYAAGGFGVYYYTNTAWDVVRVDERPPGYAYMRHLRDFFARVRYWSMRPVDGIASAGSCLADPGREYVVFLPQAAPVSLKLAGLSEPLPAEWFAAFTGERRDAGTVNNGAVELTPPAEWKGAPVALHIGGGE